MRVQVLMFGQDDPKKCTAAKMVRFGLATRVRRVGGNGIVLDPFSDRVLLRRDKSAARSIVGIDCSWNQAEREFSRQFGRTRRCLPPLLAGNPVNYSKIGMLTTAEALAAGLVILGFQEKAEGLLGKFKWGHTFFELNSHLLEEYAAIKDQGEIGKILKEYGILRS